MGLYYAFGQSRRSRCVQRFSIRRRVLLLCLGAVIPRLFELVQKMSARHRHVLLSRRSGGIVQLPTHALDLFQTFCICEQIGDARVVDAVYQQIIGQFIADRHCR